MNKALAISIVIPTFNRQDLIGRAMQSILDQDLHGIRIELIVVDNNSTDNTERVVEALAKEFPEQIRYLLEPRQGVSYARNRAIAAAAAPIVAFLDD
ncbi:MAG TPA: glycosyltransferase family A protein, partial [Blastocatellia bacterium]|nr:glycosyltransferase family A protein [Blastocatellia bacterium]